ncbi:MAG: ATP-binding protein [Pseudomonadota bacterium]
MKRIAILGAESSGKSTLAAALAERFDTAWVPEYLREFVDTCARVPFEDDQREIARIQLEREQEAAAGANAYLFCDTTPLMTALYSQFYWHRIDPEVARLAKPHAYALTLVAAPESPWEQDGLQRESEAVRQHIHEQLLAELARRGIGYHLLTGSLAERISQVEILLKSSQPA